MLELEKIISWRCNEPIQQPVRRRYTRTIISVKKIKHQINILEMPDDILDLLLHKLLG